MDQVKIGKFIASLRREKEMTQKQLSEILGISDKTVSKWECGKGLPEVSLMLPLCEVLNISINELLSGERLDAEEYQKKAEENMVTLIREKSPQKIIINFIISIVLFLISFIIIFLSAGKIVPPVSMPVAFFINIILIASNFVAGIMYGIMKKWHRLFLVGILAMNVLLLGVMIVMFGMMIIIF